MRPNPRVCVLDLVFGLFEDFVCEPVLDIGLSF